MMQIAKRKILKTIIATCLLLSLGMVLCGGGVLNLAFAAGNTFTMEQVYKNGAYGSV